MLLVAGMLKLMCVCVSFIMCFVKTLVATSVRSKGLTCMCPRIREEGNDGKEGKRMKKGGKEMRVNGEETALS